VSAIRLMREDDAETVRQVDALAFDAWWRQTQGAAAGLPPRTRTTVLAALERDPEGCFVAEEDGRAVGFIFSRTWGGVGWFGTFGLLPEYQQRGLGKQLIATSLGYLRRQPGRLIGLETMYDSPSNLGLYLRQGFRPCLPTFLLGRSLEGSARPVELPRWSVANDATRERWLADLREATSGIYPGLDYAKEIIATAKYDLGETLVLLDGDQAIGFAIVGRVSPREEAPGDRSHVEVMALHPAHTGDATFGALIEASEVQALAYGRHTLTLNVNARHAWALERLLTRGYRVWRASARMALKGTDTSPASDPYVDLSRWAG
jgi:ribosomal protein S18 acetylase RimI-like enzyme